jgi:hypothetical protein
MSKRVAPAAPVAVTKTDAEMAAQANAYFYDLAPGGQMYNRLSQAASDYRTILEAAFPNSPKEQIAMASKLADGKDDLITAIIGVKTDFFSLGFKPTVVNKDSSAGLRARKLREFSKKFQLAQVAAELTRFVEVTNNCVLLCVLDPETGGVRAVQALDPRNIRHLDNYGKTPVLSILIPEEAMLVIRRAAQVNKEAAITNYGRKYVETVEKGKAEVELRPEDGEHWWVWTRGRQYGGLARPTMHSIFADSALRSMLISGDLSAATILKNLIMLVQQGESIQVGPKAGSQENWMTNNTRLALEKAVKNIGKALTLVTDHTVKVQFLHPDPKIFAPEKFLKTEERIMRWGGVPDALMRGAAGDAAFAVSSIGVRRFQVEGRVIRDGVAALFDQMFDLREVRDGAGTSDSDVAVVWNEQVLKEPKQLLDECRTMQDQGGFAWKVYHEALGWDHSSIRDAKIAEAKDKSVDWVPLFTPGQGVTGKPGRPAEKDAPVNKEQPRPGKGE